MNNGRQRTDPSGFIKDEATGVVQNSNLLGYHKILAERKAAQEAADREAEIVRLRANVELLRRDLDFAMEEIRTLKELINR